MEQRDLARQTLVEQNMLTQLMEVLRATSDRESLQHRSSQRVGTLRFITQAFQRHLERMMSLEENDGYLDWVVDMQPPLARAVLDLREEHDRLRAAAEQLVHRLEHQSNDDGAGLDATCEELLALLRRLDEHVEKEATLLQEAVGRDEGGEG